MNNQISDNDLKKIQLDIMDEIHNFCIKNNLKYFIGAGSLIGAIRHKGYIPWDDDIDIFVPRKDYEKLITSFKSNTTEIISIYNNKQYYLPFSKAINNQTILKEDISSNISLGVNIDIFPLDSISSNDIDKWYKKQKLLINLMTVKNLKIKNRGIVKNIIVILGKIFLLPFPKRMIIKKIDSRAKMYMNDKNDMNGNLVLLTYGKKDIWKKKWFEETIELPFEDRFFLCPKGYDMILKTTYGDYMKYPPKEQQITHHSFKAYWK